MKENKKQKQQQELTKYQGQKKMKGDKRSKKKVCMKKSLTPHNMCTQEAVLW